MRLSRILLGLLVFIFYKKLRGHKITDLFRLLGTILLIGCIEKYYNCSKTKYYCKLNEFTKKVLEHCPNISKRKFRPSPFFITGLLQTMAGSLVQKDNTIQFESVKVVHSSHNVGTYNDPYITNLCSEILKLGYQPVVYHYRLVVKGLDFSDNPFDLNKDLRASLEFLQSNYPNYLKYYAIGHSYGANTLINYLGTYENNTGFEGAVSISNPYDLSIAFKMMQGNFYDVIILNLLKRLIVNNKKEWEPAQEKWNVNLEQCSKAKNSQDFLEYFTRRVQAYKDESYRHVSHYYRKHSSIRQVEKVRVPLLGIQSRDDGVAHELTLPIDEFQSNPNAILLVTESGGHVGFIEGIINLQAWYMKPTLEFITHLIKNHSKEEN